MFTRAGFSCRCSARLWAKVAMTGSYVWVWGFLVHWPAAGDYAWGSSTRIVWPHQVRIYNVFKVDWLPGSFPSSRLPQ